GWRARPHPSKPVLGWDRGAPRGPGRGAPPGGHGAGPGAPALVLVQPRHGACTGPDGTLGWAQSRRGWAGDERALLSRRLLGERRTTQRRSRHHHDRAGPWLLSLASQAPAKL